MTTTSHDTARDYALVPGWGQLPPGLAYGDAAGVTVGGDDRVYVLTRRPAVVLVFEADGTFVTSWGEGRFTERAHGITAAPDGTLYCADDADHTVRRFTPVGELLLTLGVSGRPSDTGYDGEHLETIAYGGAPFNRPTNLAVGPTGALYVSDGYGNCRVHEFAPGGELRRSWGRPGTGPGEFHLVHGIAALPDGRLLVADRENDRIQVFDQDGRFLEQWTDIQRPTHLALDEARDLIAVSELGWQAGQRSFVHGVRPYLPSRVSVLDLEGRVVDRWGGADREAAGNFVAAHSIAVDSAGSLYVGEVTWTIGVSHGLVSPECHTLQKFTRR
jgi:DNA-binding beta-propeller fold protein YncE